MGSINGAGPVRRQEWEARMAVLDVGSDQDYRAETLADITEIRFSSAYTAIFRGSQFGGGGIAFDVAVDGPAAGAAPAVIEIELDGSFNAASWDVVEGTGLRVVFLGTPGDDAVRGANGKTVENHFTGGGGADQMYGGSKATDIFVYDALDSVAPGEFVDGMGGYADKADDVLSVRASTDFSAARVQNIEIIEILGDGTVATMLRSQIEGGISGDEIAGTVQTLIIKAEDYWTSLYDNHPFTNWGDEDILIIDGLEIGERLYGSPQADTILAKGGKDRIDGQAGADIIEAGAGVDRVDGGRGNDILTGGADKDQFRFTSNLKKGYVDTIVDFTDEDVIGLARYAFDGLKRGEFSESAFHATDVGSKARDKSDRIVYNTETGGLYFDSDGKGGAKAKQFAILAGAPDLGADDFVVHA